MRGSTTVLLLASALVATPAAAQVCVGLPSAMDVVTASAGFEGRDGATGLGGALGVRAGRTLISGEFRRLGHSLQRERSYSLQAAVLPTSDARISLCPLIRFDLLDQDLPAPNSYPKEAAGRIAVGLGAAAGLPFETAYLKHILHAAPRLDVYRWEVEYVDGAPSAPELRLAPGLTSGITMEAPGLFYVRMLHNYARPRGLWDAYFTVQLGAWF